jgi:hypothetical protein
VLYLTSSATRLRALSRGVVDLLTPAQPRGGIALLWLTLTGLALTLLFFVNPEQSRLLPPCPFRAVTGVECPGCGSARAVHHLLHGRAVAAFRLNPLLALFAPFLMRGFLSSALLVARGRPLPPLAIGAGWIWLLLGTTLAFWLVRNTPLWQ